MLKTSALQYAFTRKAPLSFPDLECNANRPLLMLGPSGCGKTTFLHLAAGLLKPSAGKVLVADTDINQLPSGKKDLFRGRHIGVVFQTPHFIASLTLAENMEAALHFAGNPANPQRIGALCERLNLADCVHKKPATMSQGQLQRAGVARALINAPGLILADEPTSGLDDDNCDATLNLLMQEAAEAKAALLIVTHDSRLKNRIANQVTL